MHFQEQSKKWGLSALYCVLMSSLCAQYAHDDKWYQNPLGFKPLNLHTSMGFIVPAAITGIGLLITKKDRDLQNRLTIYGENAVTFGYKQPYTLVWQHSTGINYCLRRWLSVGVELSTTLPKDSYNRTVGFAVRPFARFYPIFKERWKIWFESGGGMIYFIDRFPQSTPYDWRTGTYWNGTTKYGLGAEITLKKRIAVNFGIRHLHVSNGNVKGSENNPSHDSNGIFIGISWHLKHTHSL